MNYVEYTEYNEHTGETRSFFLPLNGNEETFRAFDQILSDFEITMYYSIDWKIRDQKYVDTKVANSPETKPSYLPKFKKCEGVFVIPEHSSWSDLDGVLYRGGIETCFIPQQPI